MLTASTGWHSPNLPLPPLEGRRIIHYHHHQNVLCSQEFYIELIVSLYDLLVSTLRCTLGVSQTPLLPPPSPFVGCMMVHNQEFCFGLIWLNLCLRQWILLLILLFTVCETPIKTLFSGVCTMLHHHHNVLMYISRIYNWTELCSWFCCPPCVWLLSWLSLLL